MIIKEIIFETWADLTPKEQAEQKRAADNEFRALKGIDSPESQALADAFRNAFNVTGTVDSAYELARSNLRKRNLDPVALRDFDAQAKRFASAIKGGVTNPSDSGNLGLGRGKYLYKRDGSDRKQSTDKPSSKFSQGAKAVGNWAANTIPGGKKVQKALSKGVNAVSKVVDPVTAPARGGYKFFKSPDAYDTFKKTNTFRPK